MFERHCLTHFGILLFILSIAFVSGHQDATTAFMATKAASSDKQLDLAMNLCLEEKHEDAFGLFSALKERSLKDASISQVLCMIQLQDKYWTPCECRGAP
jgi:hypothetical protein